MIVLQNDEGVIDGNKLHRGGHRLAGHEAGPHPQTAAGPVSVERRDLAGRFAVCNGRSPIPACSAKLVTVPVMETSAIVTVERGHRVTLRPKMRPAPVGPRRIPRRRQPPRRSPIPTAARPSTCCPGGTVKVNGQEQEIRDVKDLPREPFRLTSAVRHFHKNRRTTAWPASRAAETCPRAHHGLRLDRERGAVSTDCKGLIYFKDCKDLKSLSLRSSQVTGAGLVLQGLQEPDRNSRLSSRCSLGSRDSAPVRGFKNLKDLDLTYTRVHGRGAGPPPGLTTRLTDFSLYHAVSRGRGDGPLQGLQGPRRTQSDGARVQRRGNRRDSGNAKAESPSDCRNSKVTDAGLASLKNFEGLTSLDCGNPGERRGPRRPRRTRQPHRSESRQYEGDGRGVRGWPRCCRSARSRGTTA